MKKYITFIIAAFCLAVSMSAQEYYYYYCSGKRVPLEVDATKVVHISPKSNGTGVSSQRSLNVYKTIQDSRSVIRVYEIPASATSGKLITPLPSSSVIVSPCYKAENDRELIPDGYIYVKLKSASDYPVLQTVVAQSNCAVIEQNQFMPLWYTLMLTAGSGKHPVEVANDLYETGLFAAASPSFSMELLDISYDPNVYEQWGLYNSLYEGLDISVSQAWNYATGRGIKIAIVDCGIDMNHIDLVDNIYPLSFDTETGTSPSVVYGDHGTHCAGIAAAVRNNGIQIAGVAPDAKLMSVSFPFGNVTNPLSKLANGINWSWKNGADIISCSWHSPESELIKEAIDSAVIRGREGKGCVFVKSAGNKSVYSTNHNITFPGNYKEDVIAVSNMTKTGELSETSCYGSNLLVAAPGTSILSTVPNNHLDSMSGTSMACPHVSGLAALILERNPKLKAEKVREIIARNAKKIGTEPYNVIKKYGTWNEKYGYGLIDAYQSVLNTPLN